MILEIARDSGYSKVMLGNCGTQLAVRLLTDMAIGRGSHAAMETVSVGLVETILFYTSITRNKKNNIQYIKGLTLSQRLVLRSFPECWLEMNGGAENAISLNEPRYEKTVLLYMRKQRRRSAAQ